MRSSRRSDSSDDEPDFTAERDALEQAEVAAMALALLRWQRAQVAAPAAPDLFERYERGLENLTRDIRRASKELTAAIDNVQAKTQLERVAVLIALRDSTDAALVAYVLAKAALESARTPPDAENELQTMLVLEEIRAAARRLKAQQDDLP